MEAAKPNRTQLLLASVLLALWVVFLTFMAIAG
jgi:hypothetical protein